MNSTPGPASTRSAETAREGRNPDVRARAGDGLKMWARCVLCFVAVGALGVQIAMAEDKSAWQIAADRGCYNCHGEPSRKGVRSFTEIRRSYTALKGRPDAERQAVERLQHGSRFAHIAPHVALSDDEALMLVRWLIAGTP